MEISRSAANLSLANIVDDYLMEITHVIRGEEWLPSLPLHVLLYRYLGWEERMPQFAHLPLLLKPDGKGKLSKRDGDKLGFPVFPLQWTDPKTSEVSSGYRESGYIPQAFINFLSLLGWNSGTEQEIFTLLELVEAFSLDRVSKSGARFDFEKAKWFNHQYLQQQPIAEIARQFTTILTEKGIKADADKITTVCSLVKERVNFVPELWNQASFFFVAPESYDAEVVKKRWKDNVPQLLTDLCSDLEQLPTFTAESFKQTVHDFVEARGAGMGLVMNALRLAMVGGSFGPDMGDIAALLGKNEVISRIKRAVANI